MSGDPNVDRASTRSRGVSRVGLVSVAFPFVAYLLTVLPYLGVKSALLFYFFAAWTRILGAGVGVILGIIACVNAPDWQGAKIGFAGIAVGVCAFVAALALALPKNG